jgi:nucleoside-diphosphate-sugar epimerase
MPFPPPTDDRPRRLIVGCGYLGERVAKRWLAAGNEVHAVTRRASRAVALEHAGIRPLIGDVTASGDTAALWLDDLPNVNTVFWAVGFDRTSGCTPRDVHVMGFGRLLDRLPGSPRIIFASSTGVWGDTDGGIVTEATPVHPDRENGRVLVEAETLLQRHRLGPGVILRFAGLYGPGRLPRLDGLRAAAPIPADPDSWLNLIHVDDAADVVCRMAAHQAPRPLSVVSDGRPIRRRDWYGRLARMIDSPPPCWDPTAVRGRGSDKRVDASAVWRDLDCLPTHPDALEAIPACLASPE